MSVADRLPRRLIRDIAHEFTLRHTDECRAQNGKGRGFICRCDFFICIEKHIVEKFHTDWSAARLHQVKADLEAALTEREHLYDVQRVTHTKLRDLDQRVGDLKIQVAVGEVVLSSGPRVCKDCGGALTGDAARDAAAHGHLICYFGG